MQMVRARNCSGVLDSSVTVLKAVKRSLRAVSEFSLERMSRVLKYSLIYSSTNLQFESSLLRILRTPPAGAECMSGVTGGNCAHMHEQSSGLTDITNVSILFFCQYRCVNWCFRHTAGREVPLSLPADFSWLAHSTLSSASWYSCKSAHSGPMDPDPQDTALLSISYCHFLSILQRRMQYTVRQREWMHGLPVH